MTVEPIGPYAIRQFEIDVLVPLSLFGHNISFTASSQAMLTTVIVVGGYLTWATRAVMDDGPGRRPYFASMSAYLLDKLDDLRSGGFLVHRSFRRAEMRQKSDTQGTSSKQVVKDIRRATRKQYSAEEKIRIVPPRFQITNSIAGNHGLTTQQPKYRVTVIAP